MMTGKIIKTGNVQVKANFKIILQQGEMKILKFCNSWF